MVIDPPASRWGRIEEILPPCIGENMKEIASLKYKSVETFKTLLRCIEEALADPSWNFPKFHELPNYASLFAKYMRRMDTMVTWHLSLLDLVKKLNTQGNSESGAEKTLTVTEVEGILRRINLYAGAMICNDQERKIWIRNSIPKEEEVGVEAPDNDQESKFWLFWMRNCVEARNQMIQMEHDENEEDDEGEEQNEIESGEDDGESEYQDETQSMEESESRGDGGDESDIIMEFEGDGPQQYVPAYDPRLGTVSVFNLNDEEPDFADPESGEGSIPDYSDTFFNQDE